MWQGAGQRCAAITEAGTGETTNHKGSFCVHWLSLGFALARRGLGPRA